MPVTADSSTPFDQLRSLLTVTDPSLARLDAAELLEELLARVRDLFGVDTVVVLLLDKAGTALTATAAHGLEEEVRQGIRVPVGRGFAGVIALTRAPMVLDEIDSSTVINPLLHRKGVRSLLGVPLMASGRLLGVIHVGSLQPRHFTEDETLLLEQAAAGIAMVLEAELARDDRTAARTLQRSLLPTRLPQVDGLTFATRFVSAERFGVGGDWFDAFPLPDGSTGIVMGDVAGSGLGAAVVMGRLRSSLRAYALESASPAEAVMRLGRKFAHFEPNEMATVLYMVVSPDLSGVSFCSKGHLPPVIARPGQPAELIEAHPAGPIGAFPPGEHINVHVPLEVGSTIGCYTDGLVERRGESIDQGLARLRESFFAGDPEAVCLTVMADLMGSAHVSDDTALLVFQRVERSSEPTNGVSRGA